MQQSQHASGHRPMQHKSGQRSTSGVFNVPARGKPRAEHHRPSPPPATAPVSAAGPANSTATDKRDPSSSPITENDPRGRFSFAVPSTQTPVQFTAARPMAKKKPQTITIDDDEESAADLISGVLIPKPTNPPPPTIYRPPKPMFSTGSSFKPVNLSKETSQPQNVIDLTKDPIGSGNGQRRTDNAEQDFDPDRALGISNSRFGAYDPSNYLDAVQTSESIKALLEGAFEDEEDSSLRRPRKSGAKRVSNKDTDGSLEAKQKNADTEGNELVDQMSGLGLQNGSAADGNDGQDEDADDGVVEGLKTKLLPHQIEGVAWMLDKETGKLKRNGVLPYGGILADDMGLGKTVQALALILSNPRPRKDAPAQDSKRKNSDAVVKTTLVVAPLALIKQWEGEVQSKVEESRRFRVLVHHGPNRTKFFEDLKKYDLVITTYQTLTSEHEASSPKDDGVKVGCFGLHWYRVILDEAHSIKNRNAKMTKAAYALKSVYRWCLSGTPMQNNLDELQSLIQFLKIKPYCELSSWKDQISGPMKNGRGGIAMKRLQYFLKACMKRRTKDVLKREGALSFGNAAGKDATTTDDGDKKKDNGFRIVDRKVETIVAEFSEHEREFYERLAARTEASLESMISKPKQDYIGALVLLLRLRQTCNHPELIRANLKKEKDTIPGQGRGLQSPRRSSGKDVDDIADMFGGLSMEAKKCDVCQSSLSKDENQRGMIRCDDCEADLRAQRVGRSTPQKKLKHKGHKKAKPQRRAARRVIESEDECELDNEDGGEWIVADGERGQSVRQARAGGSEDEDAEGGGEWLGADNSVTDSEDEDDSSARMSKFSKKSSRGDAKYFSSSSSDEESDSEDDHEEGSSSEEEEVFGQMVASTKIRKLIKILEAESSEHKFIVFSEFTSMLDIVEPFLRQHGLRFTRYDGKMKNDDREASLDRLRNDSKTRILLCSLRCGSLGLNLTAASRVVILEPFWNPFVEEQAIDRVHRLNQTQDVVVYKLTIANSVEERILALQEKKRELAKAAIEGGKAVAKLDMADILQLFKRDAEMDARHNRDTYNLTGGISSNQQRNGEPVQGKKSTWSGNNLNESVKSGGAHDVPSLSPSKSSRLNSAAKQAAARQRQQNKVPPSLQSQYDAVYGRKWN